MNVTLQEPTRSGYRLKGWAVKANATEIDYKPGDEYEMLDLIVDPITGDIINPNVLYAVWELEGIEIQYWGLTDASPTQEVLLKTVYLQRNDLFDWRYDQNKDTDTTNDYLPYRSQGWYDDWFNMYNQDWVDMMGHEPTVQDLIDGIMWQEGDGAIKVYADLLLREITVTYEMMGYEYEYAFDTVVVYTWYDLPINDTLIWQGHALNFYYDDNFDMLDATLTCGDILCNLLFDPTADEFTVYADWIFYEYTVTFIFPNGVQDTITLSYADGITLLMSGAGFEYPGFDFVGWFTQPDGQGEQIFDGRVYGDITRDDTITNLDLYAYFVPSGTVVTAEATQNSPVEIAHEAAQAVVSATADAVEPDTTMKPAKAAKASTPVAPAAKAASAATATQSIGIASSVDQAPLFGAGVGMNLDSVEAAEYAYTVNYYKNAVDAANLLGEAVFGKALLGTEIPYELGKFLPVGYTTEDALIEGALTVGENEEENVLNVIYAPELFSFFVNFYKDCMAKENLVTSVEYEAQPFGSVVDLLAEDMNKYCPKGYTALTEDTSFTVGATPAENVLNLVFKPLSSVLPSDPTEPVTPVEPNTPVQPSIPSTSVQKPVQPSSPASNVVAKTAPAAPRAWVNPVIAVPEPSYSAEPEQVANSEIIPEDSRPLAANPFAKRAQSSSTGVIGGFFLLLAAAATAASLALMRMRKQSIQAAQGLKGSALTLEQARTQRLTRYAILAAAPALVFYALWVLFLI